MRPSEFIKKPKFDVCDVVKRKRYDYKKKEWVSHKGSYGGGENRFIIVGINIFTTKLTEDENVKFGYMLTLDEVLLTPESNICRLFDSYIREEALEIMKEI